MVLDFDLVFQIFGGLIVPCLILIIYFKQRSKRRENDIPLSPHIVGEKEVYDQEALTKAEAEVAKMNLREEFAKNGLIKIDQFYTLHGYDHSSMLQMVKTFQDNNILADFIFIQSLPTGAASYMGNTGVFEFFVDSEQEEKAREILHKILNS